jgi:hypothetical protein
VHLILSSEAAKVLSGASFRRFAFEKYSNATASCGILTRPPGEQTDKNCKIPIDTLLIVPQYLGLWNSPIL